MSPSTLYRAALAAFLAVAAASASAQEVELELAWFKNRTTCDGATIIVRSHCVPEEGASYHDNCGSQELTIERPGKRPVTVDLREYEAGSDDNRIATSLRCVPVGQRRYLDVTLANGGSCDTCERTAVIGLDGQWKRYGKTWKKATAAERRAIAASEPAWRTVPSFAIDNAEPDEAAQ